MVLTGTIIGIVVALWLCFAGYISLRLGLGWRQAVLYAPLKLIFRIEDRDMRAARAAKTPVIYAISHQSRFDPALMLSLLPADTLHILDESAARSIWLEPWRELARTIMFNAGHVFVSRRLVRHLKGNGRLAVYFPASTEPDVRAFRLYRAVSRIAARAGASIVPIHVAGSGDSFASNAPAHIRLRNPFPRFAIRALKPIAIADAVAQAGAKRITNSLALFDRMMEARYANEVRGRDLFSAVVAAAKRHGPQRKVFGTGVGAIGYRALMMRVRILAEKLAALDRTGNRPVGLMLSERPDFVSALLAAHSAGRVAAPLDGTAQPTTILAQARLAGFIQIICSREAMAGDRFAELVGRLEAEGLQMLWLEELAQDVNSWQALMARFFWRRPLVRAQADEAAIILSAVEDDAGTVQAPVVLHRNLLADIGQIDARVGLMPGDRLYSAFSPASRCGLTACLFPLLSGVRQSGPDEASVAVAPAGWFAAHAPDAGETTYAALRAGLSCGEPVTAKTRDAWRSAGLEILEAYISERAGCTVALGSSIHARPGTLGRFLPAMKVRLDPVAGIENGGRLWVCGESVASAFIGGEQPGEIRQHTGEWRDTGDIVTVDREGFVVLHGSASRHASVGESLVALDSVEALARSLWPKGRHVALVLEDGRIVLVTTSRSAQRNAFRQAVKKAALDATHVPADIVRVERMPLREDGEPDPSALRRVVAESLRPRKAA